MLEPELADSHGMFDAWTALGLRFNTSSLLSQGSLFLELIMKVRLTLSARLKVRYDEQGPQTFDGQANMSKASEVICDLVQAKVCPATCHAA